MSGHMQVTRVGQGYNSFNASAYPSLLTCSSTASDPGCAADVYVCQSMAEVYSALDINADLAVSSSWAGGSFSDRFKFASRINMTSTTVVILAVATKTMAEWSIVSPTFTSPPKSALTLFKTGGDSFVSMIAQGGAYYASYSFQAVDKAQFTLLTNAVSASFGGLASQFDATFETSLANIQKTTQITYRFNQIGSGFANTKLPGKPDAIVDFVLGFNTLDIDIPATLRFTTSPYSSLADCPAGWEQVDVYRETYWDPSPVKQGLADKELAILSNSQAVKDVVAFYDLYGCLSADGTLQAAYKDLQADLELIAFWRTRVNRNPTVPGILTPPCKSLDKGVPLANYVVKSSGSGGNGGSAFDDVSREDIELGIMPSKITIRSGGRIDQIKVTYDFLAQGGPAPVEKVHGDDGGHEEPVLDLNESNRITQIQCTESDSRVRQIQIRTRNGGPRKFGPDGGNGPFQLYSTEGPTAFLGFAGRSGTTLDELVAKSIQFLPADWRHPLTMSLARCQRTERHRGKDHQALSPPVRAANVPYYVGSWLQRNLHRINLAFDQQGGWEGWLQVELATEFGRLYPSDTITREVAYEMNPDEQHPKKTDFVLVPPVGTQELPVWFELKTERASDPNGFCRSFLDDVDKVLSHKIDDGLLPCDLFVMGVTVTRRTADLARGIPWNAARGPRPQYNWLWRDGGSREIGLLYWQIVRARPMSL